MTAIVRTLVALSIRYAILLTGSVMERNRVNSVLGRICSSFDAPTTAMFGVGALSTGNMRVSEAGHKMGRRVWYYIRILRRWTARYSRADVPVEGAGSCDE